MTDKPALRGQLTTVEAIKDFVLAGNATITLVGRETRYTYKVRKPKKANPRCPYFVSVMYGSDNEEDFTYIGTLKVPNTVYEHGWKSTLDKQDVRSRGFTYFWGHVMAGRMPPQMEVWHEGRCCKCGRKLTVPESIKDGIGPECRKGFTAQPTTAAPLPADKGYPAIVDEGAPINKGRQLDLDMPRPVKRPNAKARRVDLPGESAPASVTVQRDLVSKGAEPNLFVTEASDLGLKEWPQQLTTNLGDTSPFHRVSADMDGDEVAGVRYRQYGTGLNLLVIND